MRGCGGCERGVRGVREEVREEVREGVRGGCEVGVRGV